jgi:hypothetical protein
VRFVMIVHYPKELGIQLELEKWNFQVN